MPRFRCGPESSPMPNDSRKQALQFGVGLDFDEQTGGDQRPDLHHGCGRPDLMEHLAVSAPELGPAGDIGDEHPGADDMPQAGAGVLQRFGDPIESVFCLAIGVAGGDDFAVFVRCRGSRDIDAVSRADSARIADFAFPGRA